MKGVRGEVLRDTAMKYLTLVGLGDSVNRRPYQLSGGMQQRVGIARALAIDPKVLLMDEPFGALDAQTRETLQGELLQIHARTKKTILFVTHDLDEAVLLADRVVVMQHGRVHEIVDVPLPRPRGDLAKARGSEAFAQHSLSYLAGAACRRRRRCIEQTMADIADPSSARQQTRRSPRGRSARCRAGRSPRYRCACSSCSGKSSAATSIRSSAPIRARSFRASIELVRNGKLAGALVQSLQPFLRRLLPRHRRRCAARPGARPLCAQWKRPSACSSPAVTPCRWWRWCRC